MLDEQSILHVPAVRASPENPSTPLSDPDEWLWDALGATKSDSGIRVNERTAFDSTPFLGATAAIADVTGMLPLVVYEQLEPRGKRRAREHPLYRVLHSETNPIQSAFGFRQMFAAQCVVWGNAYAEIERNDLGQIVALWPIPPWTVTPKVDLPRGVAYEVRISGGLPIMLRGSDVLHISWLAFDDILKGIGAVRTAKQSIGAALAAQKFAGKFFAQSANPSAVVKHKGTLKEPQAKRLRESAQALYGGLESQHRIALLEEGMEWQQISIDPEKSQLNALRQFQVSDQIRHLRVPAHMVADLSRSTNNNIEQQSLEFVMYGIGPWLTRIEQEFNRKLFPREQNARFFCEFIVQALLRGDTAARKDYYAAGRQWGWLSPNDILELENMPLRDDPGGEEYLTPQNIAGKPAAEPAQRVLRHLAERASGKELAAVRRAVEKFSGDLPGFRAWLDEFYAQHEAEYGGLFPGAGALRSALSAATRPEVVLAGVADSRAAMLLEGIV